MVQSEDFLRSDDDVLRSQDNDVLRNEEASAASQMDTDTDEYKSQEEEGLCSDDESLDNFDDVSSTGGRGLHSDDDVNSTGGRGLYSDDEVSYDFDDVNLTEGNINSFVLKLFYIKVLTLL